MIDFDAAIEAHVEWKMRLRILLDSGATAGAEFGALESVDHCSFSLWLHGEGRRFAGEPIYASLDRFHVEFHRAAAEVVRLAAAGERLEAESVLAGIYARQSVNLLSALMELRRRAGVRNEI